MHGKNDMCAKQAAVLSILLITYIIAALQDGQEACTSH